MRVALEDKPESAPQRPASVVRLLIDPTTGLQAFDGQTNAVYEYFAEDSVPGRARSPEDTGNQLLESLFD